MPLGFVSDCLTLMPQRKRRVVASSMRDWAAGAVILVRSKAVQRTGASSQGANYLSTAMLCGRSILVCQPNCVLE